MLFGICDSISIPKALSIKNRRLGIIFRIMQICAVVLVIVQIVGAKSWNTRTKPVSYGVTIWTERGPDDKMKMSDVIHCSDVSKLFYQYSSTTWYNSSGCWAIAEGESFTKQGANIFFPTYVKDIYASEVSPSKCASLACPAPKVKINTGDICSCQEKQDWFVKNPEQRILYLNHGFQAPKVNPFGRRSSIHSRSTVEEMDLDIETIILEKADDLKSRCKLGGKDKWSTADAKRGINAPLEEWIKCGGLTLDSFAEDARSGLPGETLAPHVRLTGLSLGIELNYRNEHSEDHSGPVCYLSVSALPLWNTQNAVAYSMLPTPTTVDSKYRYRYTYGVSVSVQASGSFAWFDFNALILVLTSSVVILSLPGTIMQMIAMYLVGRLSKVYSAIAVEKFSIVGRFHGLSARLMGHANNFLGITNQESGSIKFGITLEVLCQRMKEVLAQEKALGVLEDNEIEKMAKFLIQQMDTGGTGEISLQEYVAACNNNEAIKMTDLSTFFDDEAKINCFEWLLGDVTSGIEGEINKSQGKSKVAPYAPDQAPAGGESLS